MFSECALDDWPGDDECFQNQQISKFCISVEIFFFHFQKYILNAAALLWNRSSHVNRSFRHVNCNEDQSLRPVPLCVATFTAFVYWNNFGYIRYVLLFYAWHKKFETMHLFLGMSRQKRNQISFFFVSAVVVCIQQSAVVVCKCQTLSYDWGSVKLHCTTLQALDALLALNIVIKLNCLSCLLIVYVTVISMLTSLNLRSQMLTWISRQFQHYFDNNYSHACTHKKNVNFLFGLQMKNKNI